jgi:DNA-binding MarR family transcriptional regulator
MIMVDEAAPIQTEIPGWTADRVLGKATDIIAATVHGDTEALEQLSEEFREAYSQLRKRVQLPINPWKDQTVCYGALLALAEVAEIAAHIIIPPGILKKLLTSSEAQRILLKLAEQPGGLIKQSRISELTHIHRSNAHPTLKALIELGLLERQIVDPKGTVRTIELTSTGWAAAELLRTWGLEEMTRHNDYKKKWRRLLGPADAPQYHDKLSILTPLTEERSPRLFQYQIVQLSEVPAETVAAILQEWEFFLDAEQVDGNDLQKRYKFHDPHFCEYIRTEHEETLATYKVTRNAELRSEDLLAFIERELT